MDAAPSLSNTAFTVTTPSPVPFSLPNLHNYLSIKLISTNYLLWQTQFLPILKGFGLSHNIDGSIPSSTEFLNNHQPNPAYNDWFYKDQVVLNWIVNSLFESLVPQVGGLVIACEAWRRLALVYASSSRTQIRQLNHNITLSRKIMMMFPPTCLMPNRFSIN